tara:strand:+ start:416 stop:649 length:234 start_codon:yes stop_codon:yes gene_type:complete
MAMRLASSELVKEIFHFSHAFRCLARQSAWMALAKAFFCRPADVVAPSLIGCRLVKRQGDGSLLWGVIMETEAYSAG